jgi:autotransporter-associated beta strand protein
MITDTPAQFVSDIRASFRSTAGISAWNGPITLMGTGLQAFRVEGTATSFTIGGPVTGGNLVLFLRGAVGTGFINGTVTLDPAATVFKTDPNTWVINSTGNTWGTTQIGSTGTLRIGATNALPTTAPLVMGQNNAATVGVFDLGGFDQTIPTLNIAGTGTGQIIGNNSTSSPSTLTLAGPGTSLFPGVIRNVNGTGTQTVALTVTGGTHTLTGTNTYTGATTVNGGTLRVNGSLAAGSAVAVNAGGTLGGTGTINGPLTFNTGAILDPGASVGTLTVANSITINGGSGTQWNVELNGTAPTNADLLNVTGAASTLNFVSAQPTDKITINLIDLVGLPANTSLTYNIASVAPGTGAANILTNGTAGFDPTQYAFTTTGLNASNYSISQVGDVVQIGFTVAPVPEPAFVLAACGAGAAGISWLRRRRRLA